jgi:regulatory protein
MNEKNEIKRTYKLLQYAYSRGFEQDLVLDVLKNNEQ